MRWVIGDIHGMLRPLEALLAAVRGRDPSPAFLFVGDYVNRGPDARGVIDLLLSLPNARFARGNHDDVFDLVLSGLGYVSDLASNDPLIAFRWFMQHGLAETLMSYGANWAQLESAARRPTPQKLDAVCAGVPAAHREFLRSLPPVIEEPDFFVAHALWPADLGTDDPPVSARLAADAKLRQGILWGRYTVKDLQINKAWKRPGFFGHTPVDAYSSSGEFVPVVARQMVLLDTAAALSASGKLTAYCPEMKRFLQVNRWGERVGE